MGKMIFFVTVLIFLDLLFIVTGQLAASGTLTPGSIIFNAILNLQDFRGTSFLNNIVGDIGAFFGGGNSGTGFLALLAASAVVIGTVITTRSENLLFIPVGLTLALLTADFVALYSYLSSVVGVVFSTIIFAPVIIIFTLTILEWVRNKD